MRREMTKAYEVECVAFTRDIRALLAKRQISPPMAQVVLINTLVAMIKHLRKKDTMEEAAEDLVRTLQRATRNLTKPQPLARRLLNRNGPSQTEEAGAAFFRAGAWGQVPRKLCNGSPSRRMFLSLAAFPINLS